MPLLTVCIVVNSEAFWMNSAVSAYGRLARTCKSLMRECDLQFAMAHLPAAVTERVVSKVWAKRWLGLCDHWMAKKRLTLQVAIAIALEHGGVGATVARGLVFQHREKESRAKRVLQTIQNGHVREQFIADHDAVLVQMGVPGGYFRHELSLHFQYHSTTRLVDLIALKTRYLQQRAETPKRSYFAMLDDLSVTLLAAPKKAKA
jgi:hypothetical protein